LKHGGDGLTKFGPQLSHRLESPFGRCHQFSGGELGLGVFAVDDLLLHPILLHCGHRGLVRIREGLYKSNEREGKWCEGAKAEEWRRERTMKSVL
jgi:hypothetical protein